MRPFFLMIVLVIAGIRGRAQPMDTLHWQEGRLLGWTDYAAAPPAGAAALAHTATSFVTIQSRHTTATQVNVVVKAVLYRRESWVRPGGRTAGRLNHEQGHFDITAVFARRANLAFGKYKANRKTIQEDIQRIFEYYTGEKNRVQRNYEEETAEGSNAEKQLEWDLKIAAWLKGTEGG